MLCTGSSSQPLASTSLNTTRKHITPSASPLLSTTTNGMVSLDTSTRASCWRCHRPFQQQRYCRTQPQCFRHTYLNHCERRKSRWYQSAYGYWRRCGQHDLPVGQKQEVDPGWADTDTLEQEYGDIVGNIHGAFKYFADVIYHAKRNTRFRWPSSEPKVIRARPTLPRNQYPLGQSKKIGRWNTFQ